MEPEVKSVEEVQEEITRTERRKRRFEIAAIVLLALGVLLMIGWIALATDTTLSHAPILWVVLGLATVLLAVGIVFLIIDNAIANESALLWQKLERRNLLVLDGEWYEWRGGQNLLPIKAPYLKIESANRPNYPPEVRVTFSLGQTGINIEFVLEGDAIACFNFFHLQSVVPFLRNLIERECDDWLYLIRVMNTPLVTSEQAKKLEAALVQKLHELAAKFGPYRFARLTTNMGEINFNPTTRLLHRSLFPDPTTP